MDFEEIEGGLKKYRTSYNVLIEQMKTCGCTKASSTDCSCTQRDSVKEAINFLVRKVLGYIEEKEVVHVKCGIHKVVPIRENCNEEIKFLLRAHPPQTPVSEWDIDRSCARAIDGKSNLLIITNGQIFRLYAVGDIDGELIQELIFEYNLLKDDLKLLCDNLWCLCRKECGRKIVIDFVE